jgi:predicted lipid-binding transport protein (Tim44 family)
MEILFFAVVAAFVLARLYMVLGQNKGAEPPAMRPTTPLARTKATDTPEPDDGVGETGDKVIAFRPRTADGPAAAGLAAIGNLDRTFEAESFLEGAKAAYEMIVTAYGSGDEETLRPLVDDDVFAAYKVAMDERRAADAKRIEVVRLSESKIVAAEVEGKIARIDVKFSSDLADGGDGLRAADEIWTFERNTSSKDPNWLLSAVETA